MIDTTTTALEWDKSEEKFYETGVDRGIVFLKNEKLGSGDTAKPYNKGAVWNGLISVSENPSGAEANPLYADNIKYLELTSNEEFGASVECYTYPDIFQKCLGEHLNATAKGLVVAQQKREVFGMYYRTKIGDADGNEKYKHHLVYGAKAAPSEKSYSTVNDSPEAITFSFEVTTTPENISSIKDSDNNALKPTSIITIDERYADETKLDNLLAIVYGKKGSGTEQDPKVDARLPLPDEVYAILTAESDPTPDPDDTP